MGDCLGCNQDTNSLRSDLVAEPAVIVLPPTFHTAIGQGTSVVNTIG